MAERRYTAVIEFDDDQVLYHGPTTRYYCIKWIEAKKKFYRVILERKPFQIYLLTASIPKEEQFVGRKEILQKQARVRKERMKKFNKIV